MGAVLALRVRLMRYVQIFVDVAIAVCDLFCPVPAVSYTHLDVYKRQSEYGLSGAASVIASAKEAMQHE